MKWVVDHLTRRTTKFVENWYFASRKNTNSLRGMARFVRATYSRLGLPPPRMLRCRGVCSAAATPSHNALCTTLEPPQGVSATAALAHASPPSLGEPLGHWPPDLALQLVELVHERAALEWWVAIAASTLAVRMALLPLSLHATKQAARMQAMREPLAQLQARARCNFRLQPSA